MPNVLTGATAEGLPSLTRRLFLRRAAIAAPLAAVPALAAAATVEPEENPALLALEPELTTAAAEMNAAADAYDEALRVGTALWPRAPEAIAHSVLPEDRERDITGAGYRDGRFVRKRGSLRLEVQACKRWRKITPEREEQRRRAEECLALAETYEAGCAHAKAVADFDAANNRRDAAGKALNAVIDRIDAEPARTPAGLRFKAQAFHAWERAPDYQRTFNVHGVKWSQNFARAVAEIVEAAR